MGSRIRAHFLQRTDHARRCHHGFGDDIRDRIDPQAERRSLQMRDFAATMICLITDGSSTIVAHVGDGSAVARCTDTQEWVALSWPQHGQYAATTYFVTDDPVAQLRVSRRSDAINALAIFQTA